MRGSVHPLRPDLVLIELVWEPEEEPQGVDSPLPMDHPALMGWPSRPGGPGIPQISGVRMINPAPGSALAIGRIVAVKGKQEETERFDPELFEEEPEKPDPMSKLFKNLFGPMLGQMTERSRGVAESLSVGDLVLFSRWGTGDRLPEYLEDSKSLRLISESLIFAKIEPE